MDQRVAINGFGRIGRLVLRQLLEHYDEIEVVATNDVAPLDNLAYLLKHDSVHRDPSTPIEGHHDTLRWGDKTIRFLQRKDPAELPWQDLEVSLVIEASGRFTSRKLAARHLQAGAKRVLVTAPADNADLTVCVGVNDDAYDAEQHEVVSNASCTTNCLAPVAKVLDDAFGIRTGFLTTVHAVTRSQGLVDEPNRKWRRGRAAMTSIVPTMTGAARATAAVLPKLAGRIDGIAMRVPVIDGSIIDFVAQTERRVTVEAVNRAFEEAAATQRLRGILGVSDEELVSADVIGTTWSALVDTTSTAVLGGHTVKVLAWYDNEWGYARRVADMARRMVADR